MTDETLTTETAQAPAPVKPRIVEAPCTIRFNPETGRVSLGCTTGDLEGFINQALDAYYEQHEQP